MGLCGNFTPFFFTAKVFHYLLSFLNWQFTYMIFIYLQSCIHHFMGLFETNIMTSSQLAC